MEWKQRIHKKMKMKKEGKKWRRRLSGSVGGAGFTRFKQAPATHADKLPDFRFGHI